MLSQLLTLQADQLRGHEERLKEVTEDLAAHHDFLGGVVSKAKKERDAKETFLLFEVAVVAAVTVVVVSVAAVVVVAVVFTAVAVVVSAVAVVVVVVALDWDVLDGIVKLH